MPVHRRVDLPRCYELRTDSELWSFGIPKEDDEYLQCSTYYSYGIEVGSTFNIHPSLATLPSVAILQ